MQFLDGIRGFMAMNVVLEHFALLFFPAWLVGQTTDVIGPGLLIQLPRALTMNGTVAVQYFFVLTGFLVGRSFFTDRVWRHTDLLDKCVNRYLRMLPMVAGATLFVYLTMVLGLQFHYEIAKYTPNPAAVNSYCAFIPTIPFLIKTVFYKTFLENSIFVTPFWTIRYEFWGYILCMLTCYVCRDSKLRRLFCCAVLVLVWSQISEYYVGFFLGVLTADLCLCRDGDTTVLSPFYQKLLGSKGFLWLMLALGFCLTYFPLYSGIPVLTPITARALGVSLMLHSLVRLPRLRRVFENKFLLRLGRASFGIYAFHWPLMLSFQAKVFSLIQELPYQMAAWLSFILTMPVILAVGQGAYWLLEKKCALNAGPLLAKLRK